MNSSVSRPPAFSIFHCDPCGLCRVREKPSTVYFHCATCNICLTEAARAAHTCVERALESNCPVCTDWMHSSREPCSRMPNCGHFMHTSCYNQYIRSSATHTCPVCAKTLLSASERAAQTAHIDAFLRIHRVRSLSTASARGLF